VVKGVQLLTRSIASLTRSFLISSTLNRFSTSSVLVDPEEYHAIENALVICHFAAGMLFGRRRIM